MPEFCDRLENYTYFPSVWVQIWVCFSRVISTYSSGAVQIWVCLDLDKNVPKVLSSRWTSVTQAFDLMLLKSSNAAAVILEG